MQKRAAALTKSHALQLAGACDQKSLQGLRDRAMILLGFAGAFRRSEIFALTVADLRVLPDGLRLRLPRSKTDQESIGRAVWIARTGDPATCAVESLRRWLVAAQISQGPLFRKVSRTGAVGLAALSPQTLNTVLKRGALRLWGVDAARQVSGHSLRAGFCTEAAQQGVPLHVIRRQTGHTSIEGLMRYIRISGDQHVPALL
jgi:integrase